MASWLRKLFKWLRFWLNNELIGSCISFLFFLVLWIDWYAQLILDCDIENTLWEFFLWVHGDNSLVWFLISFLKISLVLQQGQIEFKNPNFQINDINEQFQKIIIIIINSILNINFMLEKMLTLKYGRKNFNQSCLFIKAHAYSQSTTNFLAWKSQRRNFLYIREKE